MWAKPASFFHFSFFLNCNNYMQSRVDHSNYYKRPILPKVITIVWQLDRPNPLRPLVPVRQVDRHQRPLEDLQRRIDYRRRRQNVGRLQKLLRQLC